jgi:hypothetical protein
VSEGLDRVRPWEKPPASERVKHACPECPLGAPRVDCWCCGGHGAIDEAQLARWQRTVNRAAAL